MLVKWFPNLDMEDFWQATYETCYMTILALIGPCLLGILLGLLLYLTMNGRIWEVNGINVITATIVNVFLAFPFIILILPLFPFTNFFIGTIRGPNAALPALIIG